MNTIVPHTLITLQNELLMSIGTLTDPDEILKEFSIRAMKTLNLKRIYFIQKENKLSALEEKTVIIPLSARDLIAENTKLTAYKNADIPQENTYIEEIEVNDSFIYCFAIKNVGFIFFERKVMPFDESLIQALIIPIIRFSLTYVNQKQFKLHTQQRDTIKEFSNALKLDKAKFETILGAIKDGVIAINNHKKIFFANQSAHNILGLNNDTKLDKKYYEYFRLFTNDESKDITRKLETFAIKNDSWSSDEPVIFKAQNQKKIVCEINVQKIWDNRESNNGSDVFYVITFHDISEAFEMEQALAWQATHDSLTQCLNRTGFERKLQSLLENNNSENHAFICMDLDRFKHVNDIGGHIAGDGLLKRVAAVINQEIRQNDLLARVGGDEFCIIAMNCEIKYAMDLAERIRKKVERIRFQLKENIFSVGISIGVTAIEPIDRDPDLVFFKANEACMNKTDAIR